jgi:hypothetical protein
MICCMLSQAANWPASPFHTASFQADSSTCTTLSKINEYHFWVWGCVKEHSLVCGVASGATAQGHVFLCWENILKIFFVISWYLLTCTFPWVLGTKVHTVSPSILEEWEVNGQATQSWHVRREKCLLKWKFWYKR